MAPPRLPALHPAIADVYRAKVAALQEALTRGQDREAFEAARAPIDRIVIPPPQTGDDPPGIELVGELAELLRAGILDDAIQGALHRAGQRSQHVR